MNCDLHTPTRYARWRHVLRERLLPHRIDLELRLRYELQHGEPEVRLVPLLAKRSRTSLDIGANVGVYAYYMARHSARVFAIEALPALADRLRKSLPRKVTVLEMAASKEDRNGVLYVPIAEGREVHTRCSLEMMANHGSLLRSAMVEVRRIDNVIGPSEPIAFAKIDVEGHEMSVLEGMINIMLKNRPALIVESEAKHNSKAPFDVFELTRDLGYDGFFCHRGKLRAVSEFSVEQYQKQEDSKPIAGTKSQDYINNFIFVHSSQKDDMAALASMLSG